MARQPCNRSKVASDAEIVVARRQGPYMQWIPPSDARRARVDGPYTLDDVAPRRAIPPGEVAARRSVSNRESPASEEFTANQRERGHRVNTSPKPNDSYTRCKSWDSLA